MANVKHNDDDIKLTRDEIHKLNEAFHDKTFLKLFQDYVEDINSAESRQKYEEEIIMLEKERGFDVKFVHPVPCYVMKFVLNEKKIFVNVCKNQYVGEATYEKRNSGTQWKIPVILSKPRDDMDKKGSKCKVYDVMFHPQTTQLALTHIRFKGIVEDTALSMICEKFGISLDIKAVKYPKLKYKGKPPHVVLRKMAGTKDISTDCESLEEYYKNHLEPQMKQNSLPASEQPTDLVNQSKSSNEPETLTPIVPKYTVKYRDIIDMKDFSLMGYTDKCAPKAIVIEISLPGVLKATDVEIDVFERKISLRSCQNVNHYYQLILDLSYAVNTKEGKAKFDKSNHKLSVELPLKDRGIPTLSNENASA